MSRKNRDLNQSRDSVKTVSTSRELKKDSNFEKPASSSNEKPIWRFDRIDRDGPFAFNLARQDFKHKEVLQKLMEYGCMTWNEIVSQTHDGGKSKHHYLSSNGLSKDACERINTKCVDHDNIFSFALQNKLRIIGLREGAEFYIVWYDPEHKFCPGSKK